MNGYSRFAHFEIQFRELPKMEHENTAQHHKNYKIVWFSTNMLPLCLWHGRHSQACFPRHFLVNGITFNNTNSCEIFETPKKMGER
jgi:hypothetical protein